jgi:hypothetical protein
MAKRDHLAVLADRAVPTFGRTELPTRGVVRLSPGATDDAAIA